MGIVLRGWRKFVGAMRRVGRRLGDEELRRMREATLFLRGEVLEYIESERHGVPNAPLTILIKGSSKPLVDRGDLRLGITTEARRRGRNVEGAVGVLRSRRKKGKRLTNVAAALHEGYKIRLTPKMKAAIFAELDRRLRGKRKRREARKGRGFGSGASTWRVKGRPFIRVPLKESEQHILEILGAGVRVTFKKL